jgi:hypothetical protein
MLNAPNHIFYPTAGKVAIALAVLTWPLEARTGAEPRAEAQSLYLNVEKGGGLIIGLMQANFRLYVNGKPYPFRLEKPEEPASIALLVEHSGPSGYFADDLNAALQGFLSTRPRATGTHSLRFHTNWKSIQISPSRSAK